MTRTPRGSHKNRTTASNVAVMPNTTQETAADISLEDLTGVCDEVDTRCAEIYGRVFAQWRTALKAASYVEALCRHDIPVKTCWDLAQAAGYELAKPFQSLIGTNRWNHQHLWNEIATQAQQTLTCPPQDPLGPGIALDETAQAKRGHHTAGVGIQYAGFAGHLLNCVTSVVASLVTPHAATWIAAERFLQEKEWFTGHGPKGTARRIAAGVPAGLRFESKPQIAARLLTGLREQGITINWAAGDEVYGRSADLRRSHEDNGEAYAYFVPRNFHVPMPTPTTLRADELLQEAQGHFEERAAGPGTNGPRWYEWAMIATASPEHFLLIRRAAETQATPTITTDPDPRTRELPPGTGFMYCHVPATSPIKPTLTNLLIMIGRRWPVEETIAVGKGPIGWDENQFRTWTSAQRHTALSAMAMLRTHMTRVSIERASRPQTAHQPTQSTDQPTEQLARPVVPHLLRPKTWDIGLDCPIPTGDAPVPRVYDQPCPPDIGCIRLSIAETLRLAGIVRARIPRTEQQFLLRWSWWRRRHQAIARWHHTRRRLAAAITPTDPTPLR